MYLRKKKFFLILITGLSGLFLSYVKVLVSPKIVSPPFQLRITLRRREPLPHIPESFHVIRDDVTWDFVDYIKNPCWFQNKTLLLIPGNESDHQRDSKVLRCLPFFFIAGQKKCGTSDFAHRLALHPDVVDTGKEKHWWHFSGNKGFPRVSFNKYIQKFFKLSSKLQSKCSSYEGGDILHNQCQSLISYDATPAYLWNLRHVMLEYHKLMIKNENGTKLMEDFASRRLSKTISKEEIANFTKHAYYSPFTIADLVRKILPNSRFITLLRDPVDRVYSDYKFLIKLGIKLSPHYSPRDFHTQIIRKILAWKSCTRNHDRRFCIYNLETHFDVGLLRSIYVVYLKDWFAVFPRERFLIHRYEDYIQNMNSTLAETHRFLGLRNHEIELNKEIRNKGVKFPPMLNKTRNILTKFYAEYNAELAELLKDQRFLFSKKV